MLVRIYKVEGYTPSTCLGVIDNYKSFEFTKSFKKAGTWRMKGYLPPQTTDMLVPGNMIYVNDRVCGLIDGVEFDTDEKGVTTYTAYGSELKNILSYRVLWQTFIATPGDEPPVENWMRFLVSLNCIPTPKNIETGFDINRALINHLDVPDDNYLHPATIGTPRMDSFFTQVGENLLEVLVTMCQKFKTNKGLALGFDVVCKNAKETYFTLYEGADRTYTSSNPVIFSREYDNVSDLVYTRSNKNSVNVCRVIGDGAETIVGEESAGTGLARRETIIDISAEGRTVHEPRGDRTLSEAEYQNKMKKEGYKNLTFDINNLDAQIMEKGTNLPDYDLLGARVSLVDKRYNLRADDWISEINFIDEGGEIEINYRIGEDIQAKVLKEVK